MPAPPYSGSIGPPRKPSSPMRRTRCCGKMPVSSASRATGAISCSANWRAAAWTRCCSGIRLKSTLTLCFLWLSSGRARLRADFIDAALDLSLLLASGRSRLRARRAGRHQKCPDERMRLAFQSRAFRLEECAQIERMPRKLEDARLAAAVPASDFDAALLQQRLIARIQAEAAMILLFRL